MKIIICVSFAFNDLAQRSEPMWSIDLNYAIRGIAGEETNEDRLDSEPYVPKVSTEIWRIGPDLLDVDMANFYGGNYLDAYQNAKTGFDLAQTTGNIRAIMNSSRTLKIIFQKQNKYKQVFDMYALEIKMSDSINNQETRKASVKKQFQYEYEKQAAADSGCASTTSCSRAR